MKAILEFNLPEEGPEHRNALDGWKWKVVVENILANIRQRVKYEDPSETEQQVLEKMRETIGRMMRDESLDLDS